MNGLSHYFEDADPRLALRLNPFNMDARVGAFVGLLEDDGIGTGDAGPRLAEGALRFSPGDARAYSMRGEVARWNGDDEAASLWFAQALRHSKTEIRALLDQLQCALAEGEMEDAVRHFDITLRRWPGHWSTLEAIVPEIVSSPAGRTALRARLARRPPWRGRVLARLLATAEGLPVVESLLLEPGGGATRAETNAAIAAMVRHHAPRRAYQFFLSTLSSEDRSRFGYVFNPRFLADPQPSYFGWRIKGASGAETTREAGLRVRFRDMPARLGNVSQVLSLPAGRFAITATTTAQGLAAPRELFWTVSCQDRRRTPIAALAVPEGSYRARPLSAAFEVPASGCPLQVLTLATGLTVDSWRYRYRGEVVFDSVAIARLD